MEDLFELCLFSADPLLARAAAEAGIDSIIVDWENKGKESRQAGFDTQINHQTIDDLIAVRSHTDARVICRINAIGEHSEQEIHAAVIHGADEILIPMVRTVEEVELALQLAGKRIKVGILIETNAAIEIAEELSQLPLSRIYIGLNDLAIENHDHNIFTPLADGRLERVRSLVSVSFGFGGLTLPTHGHPIPCHLFMEEMMRLGCQFTFLRRSFLKDIQGKNLSHAIRQIREGLEMARNRSEFEEYSDHKLLVQAIGEKVEV